MHSRHLTLLGLLLTAATGCGGDAPVTPDTPDAPVPSPAVPTASRPADACGWLSASEVERIVGPLTGAPTPVVAVHEVRPATDGEACLYPLAEHPQPEVVEQRNRLRQLMAERLGGRGAFPVPPLEEGEIDLEVTPGVVVGVMINSDDKAERAFATARHELAGGPGRGDEGASNGWDSELSIASARMYRQGHISLYVRVTEGVPDDTVAALAARVREQITDLPFATTRPAASRSSGPDPCSLLTREEAEAVLGPLAAPPYRSDEESPLVNSAGASCTYYTAGHHVLILTPHWTGGASEFDATRGLGGLLGGVLPREEPVPDGPWDKAVPTGLGAILFLKGDAALDIQYALSATDRDGALRLAARAVPRLAR